LRPAVGDLRPGTAYLGGSASQVEKHLKLSGDEILYVGDHMFGDVHVTKSVLRWRTGLILRELEDEVLAVEKFRRTEALIAERMREKEALEDELCQLRLAQQRRKHRSGPQSELPDDVLGTRASALKMRVAAIDAELGPLAQAAGELSNPQWGLLMRAGNDKSHLARQVERHSDIYTSRVSNFLHATPYVYLRSPRGSLPHDPSVFGNTPLGAPST
ncbi:MAG: 5'-nucleotidase domain-containing protein, partial [Myxococcaceae bacterium]